MLQQRFLVMLCVMTISLLGAVACTPAMQSQTGAIVPSSANPTPTSQVQSNGEGVVVDVTPMSAAELAAQPQGQTAAGGAAATGDSQSEPGAPGEVAPSGTMLVYADSNYGFSMSYPNEFVFRSQPAENLAQLDPLPVASFTFMNPTTAASDVAELEPADLEIRVYASETVSSLDGWLVAQGLSPAGGAATPKTFQAANVSGVEVCASTLIGPGCSYFFMGAGWIYRLTPATQEGEAMMQSFTVNP